VDTEALLSIIGIVGVLSLLVCVPAILYFRDKDRRNGAPPDPKVSGRFLIGVSLALIVLFLLVASPVVFPGSAIVSIPAQVDR
jgi:hypothetical protein